MLTPEEEARFRERLSTLFLGKLRWGSLAACALFAAFTLLDYVLEPTSLERNWPVRVIAVTGYLALYLATRWRGGRQLLPLLFYAAVAFGAVAVTHLSLGLPRGETLLAGSLMLMITLIAALGPRFGSAIIAYALLLVTYNVTALALGATPSYLVAVSAFAFAGAVTGSLMALVADRLGRRAFKLELELEAMATRDALTGARNRASFLAVAAKEVERSERYGSPLSLLLLDIDRFKSINDTHGHPAGDAVIQALARGAQLELRTVDPLGRLGGEEFAVLLPESPLEAAQAVAERLRAALEALTVPVDGKALRFTVSIGAAERAPGEPLDRLIIRADQALYAAKHGGRNQVRAA